MSFKKTGVARATRLSGLALGVLALHALSATAASAASGGADEPSTQAAEVQAPAAAVPEAKDARPVKAEPSSNERAYMLDARYGYKGWIVQFPSFGDSLVGDDGYWRTNLAKHGFGFSVQGVAIFQSNVLDRPSRIPSTGYAPCGPNNLDYSCAGGRSYFGQRPSLMVANSAFLTYDLSQYGVPDGQLALGVNFGRSSDQQYAPDTMRFNGLSYYQTLFDKKIEFKIGYFANLPEFAGTFVGGMVVNPFGPTASVPIILGMSPNNISTPNVRVKWNITDAAYAQVSVQRSLPVHGASGNSIHDEIDTNPTGLKFHSPVGGTRELYINEIGYKRASSANTPFTWVRLGYMNNNSDFVDYSRLLQDQHAKKKGADGYYLLADFQVTQTAPDNPHTAYKGLYLGASYMQADPKSASFTKYFEARAYKIGPFASRPSDMLSFVYSHNRTSKYLQDVLSTAAPFTNFEPIAKSNSITAAYTYRIKPGLYATGGLGFTDEPSLTKFKGEGNALNALLSLYWIF
jgi:porin